MSVKSGRRGTGFARYRRNRKILLTTTDICGICGHPGATTADHIVRPELWKVLFPDDPKGCDELPNLQPAHGTMGPLQPANPCPVCRKLCNQSRGSRLPVARPQSRRW